MRIALAQMKNEGTIQDNLDKSIEFIRQAYENHASLILFPEVHINFPFLFFHSTTTFLIR